MKIFGYEPAAIVGVVEAALSLALAFGIAGLTQHTVGLIMACVTAVLGVVVAIMTEHKTLSAVIGLCKAMIALGIGFGLSLTDVQAASIIAFVTVVGGLFLRTQTSPAPRPLHK